MVAVVMVYNVNVLCSYLQKVELHQCDQVYTESHIPTKTNFITFTTSQLNLLSFLQNYIRNSTNDCATAKPFTPICLYMLYHVHSCCI